MGSFARTLSFLGRSIAPLAVVLVSVGVSAVASPTAHAQSQSTTNSFRARSPRFDVHADLGWYRFFGVGFRVELPIVPHGLISRADDELALTFGSEFAWFYQRHGDKSFGVYPMVALQWNFYVGREWSLFPELGVAFLFDPLRNDYYQTFVGPHVGVGLRYHFETENALLFRVTWPGGFQVGVTF